MTRYADPHRCPDCRGPIEYAAQSCPSCGLLLRDPLAGELYRSLMTADRQLEQLRALSTATTTLTSDLEDAEPGPAQALPPAARVTAPTRMSSASVPKVLLTLGAGCVLVAALVFLAVTWSALGVAGRTTVLVTLTVAAGVATAWLCRRELRVTAEATELIGFGLLALDLIGAKHSGWLGGIDRGGFLVLLGAVMLAVATSTALVTRRVLTGGLLGTEAVTVTAAAILAIGLGTVIGGQPEVGELVCVLVLASLTGIHHRLGLRWAGRGLAVEALVAWLVLSVAGAARAVEHDTLRGLWLHGEAWPLMSAAVLAAAVTGLRGRQWLRVGGVAVAVLTITGVVLLPLDDAGGTRQLLALTATLVLLSGATMVLRGPWRFAPSLAQAAVGCLTAAGVLSAAAVATERLVDGAQSLWAGGSGDRLPGADPAVPAGWLLPLAVGALLTVAASHARRLHATRAHFETSVVLTVPLVAALTLAAYPVPVCAVEATLAIGAVVGLLAWLRGLNETVLAGVAGYLLAALAVGLHAPWLTLFALVLTVALAAGAGFRTEIAGTATAAGLGLGLAVGGTAWTVGHCLHAAESWTALGGLSVLGVLVLAAPALPGPRRGDLRLGVEAGAAAAAVSLALAGTVAAPEALEATWAAVYLTVSGAFVTVLALVRADRRAAAWLGGALLAAGTWVRLWDIGVHAPEAYTLPSAVALLLVGWARLRRRGDVDTMSSLAPGLGLALTPSLLWVLAEPTGWRPLLLGLGCLALVLGGTRMHWTAPIVCGATVGALLVVRLAAPYIDEAVPRWVLLGTAGGVLLGVGATWEQRLREARSLMSYVRALR
ncbi:MAG: SCO7613 C-terminal domain-containing membrane protein [Nocardioidaceae bacterium]